MSSLRYTVSPTYHILGDTKWKTWDVIDQGNAGNVGSVTIAACPTRRKAELVTMALNQWDIMPQGVTA